MDAYNRATGLLLRQLRKGRRLTLVEAAPLFPMSVAGLSRRERGIDHIGRREIRQAISAYQLTPWETYQLWITAGYLADPVTGWRDYPDLRTFAETLITHLSFPAFIADMLGYVKAWNTGIQRLWEPDLKSMTPPHIIDDLFADRTRNKLGEGWERYAQSAILVFYHKSLRVANDPLFRRLLSNLQAKHGETFIRMWNSAQSQSVVRETLTPLELGITVVQYDSPAGPIRYLIMQSLFQFPTPYELFLYIPFGEESWQRYAQLPGVDLPSQLFYYESSGASFD